MHIQCNLRQSLIEAKDVKFCLFATALEVVKNETLAIYLLV